ncbi:hypothetical protein [Alteribacter aurantiacus]|uniref:hypothetical protein n=1 Tax=Alteribacter aurantiacus TaxID=254410 RepID=UPI000401BEF3|nr:hypothetical protein [Alteribacter aurantiacus]
MKHWLLQGMTVLVIGLLLFALEYIGSQRTVESVASECSVIHSGTMTFMIVSVIVVGFYVLFTLEGKKSNNLLNRSFWTQMPFVSGLVGIVSAVLFLAGGVFGPLMEWTTVWPTLFICFSSILCLSFTCLFSQLNSVEKKRRTIIRRRPKSLSFGP